MAGEDRFIEVPDWVARRPPARPPERTEAQAPAPTWSVTLADGETFEVTGFGLIGRAPAAERGEPVVHLIGVGSGERSVSKTHVGFGVDPEGFWVIDRHSTNGTTVIRATGERQACRAGEIVRVADGDRVAFGDLEFSVNATPTPA